MARRGTGVARVCLEEPADCLGKLRRAGSQPGRGGGGAGRTLRVTLRPKVPVVPVVTKVTKENVRIIVLDIVNKQQTRSSRRNLLLVSFLYSCWKHQNNIHRNSRIFCRIQISSP